MLLVLTVGIVELATGRACTVLLVDPLVNALVILDILCFGQFGLAILLFTVLLRVVTLPMTINTYRSMKSMQAIQPKIQEIDKKYKDPKRQERRAREAHARVGVQPARLPLSDADPDRAVLRAVPGMQHLVGGSPESVVGLSEHLYPILVPARDRTAQPALPLA